LYFVFYHSFNKLQAILHIIIEVFLRVSYRFSDETIGCKMHHSLNGVGPEGVIQFLRISQIPEDQWCSQYSLSMSCLQVVINDWSMASVEQFLHHMASDISCASCDKDRRNSSPLSSAKSTHRLPSMAAGDCSGLTLSVAERVKSKEPRPVNGVA
jgi:hypothetical protein